MPEKPFWQQPSAHNTISHTASTQQKKETPAAVSSRPVAVPLDFHTFCAVHVVAFSVGRVILGVGGGGGFEVLRVLGEFHALGLGPRLVAELDERHHHGQAQAPHQDVEHPGDIAEAQSARLVLRETSHAVSFAARSRQTDRQQAALVLAGVTTLVAFGVPLLAQSCPPVPGSRGCAAATAPSPTLRWGKPWLIAPTADHFWPLTSPASRSKPDYGRASPVAKAPWESSVGDSSGCINQQVLQEAITKQKEKPKPLHT